MERTELKKRFIACLTIALAARAVWPADNFSLRGYFKNFSILIIPPAYTQGFSTLSEPDLGAVNNRLRLDLTLRPSDRIAFEAEYDLSPRIQDARLFRKDLFFPGLQQVDYRVADLRDYLYPPPGETPESFALYQNLDRFMLTIKTAAADIIVGRQVVAWGSARVVNPTDVLAPFAFNELDKEERLGVDALRIRVPLGAMDELDFGIVAGDDLKADNNAYFLRGRTYFSKTDLSGLALVFRKHLLVGLDLARAIGGAGFWFEAAYVIPNAFQEENGELEQNYFRSSLGLDYNLSSKTYGFAEYHYNSAGGSRPEDYIRLFGTSAYRDGSVYLLGRHYLNIGATVQVSPLLPFTGLLILNLSDGSLMLSPSLEYNIAENIYLAGGAYLGLGKRPEIVAGMLDSTPRVLHSEFGAYPDMLFTSFRVYF
jgi:hypothetical protein